MRKRVYIAGPISKGDLAHNIRQAEEAFFKMLKAGLAPFCPHWSCYSTGPRLQEDFLMGGTPNNTVYAVATSKGGGGCGHAEWLGVDLSWVSVANVLLRLPGESKGADMEVDCAIANQIPVFHDLDELIAWAA